MSIDLHDKFHEYMKYFWLRPENGLLCTLKSEAFADIPIVSPSLDISCGDGVFMFLHLGGAFNEDFDAFNATRADEFKHDQFVDIYDSYKEGCKPNILSRPQLKIDQGTDWKQSLLDKAKLLDLYGELRVHDNNITPLPFDAETFQTIYSNAVYWVKDIVAVLKEIHRMLKPGGRAVLEVMSPYFLETLDRFEKVLGPKAIAILNRQRRETMPGGHTYDKWCELFEHTGFNIESVRNTYPNSLLMDIWNVGLRPISHLLIQMVDTITPENRRRVKSEWLEIIMELCLPLIDLPGNVAMEKAPYIMFDLVK